MSTFIRIVIAVVLVVALLALFGQLAVVINGNATGVTVVIIAVNAITLILLTRWLFGVKSDEEDNAKPPTLLDRLALNGDLAAMTALAKTLHPIMLGMPDGAAKNEGIVAYGRKGGICFLTANTSKAKVPYIRWWPEDNEKLFDCVVGITPGTMKIGDVIVGIAKDCEGLRLLFLEKRGG